MKKLLNLCLFSLIFTSGFAQKSKLDEEIVRSIADRILDDTHYGFVSWISNNKYNSASEIPEGEPVRFESQYLGWYYPNGVINIAMVDLGELLGEQKYTDHAINMINFAFDNYPVFENRLKPGMRERGYPYRELFIMRELDDCGAIGASAIEVYQKEKRKDVMDYIDKVAVHITKKQDRLEDGTLVRKFPNEMTLWADDLYMSVPFLARMGNLTGDEKYFNDAAHQVLKFNDYLWNEDKGLYYHCYFSDLERNGVAHWGRCNGWIMMATVNLLNFIPEDHPQREQIRLNLEKHILGIAKYQDENGLWHQLLDKNDSYEESSCSAMFVYTIARAVNMGWIDKRYASIAIRGWQGLTEHMITHDGQLRDVCVGTGIQNDLVFYYTRPKRLNEVHGLGAILEAGIEIIILKNKEN